MNLYLRVRISKDFILCLVNYGKNSNQICMNHVQRTKHKTRIAIEKGVEEKLSYYPYFCCSHFKPSNLPDKYN